MTLASRECRDGLKAQPEVAARVAESVGVFCPRAVKGGLEAVVALLDDEPVVFAQDCLFSEGLGTGWVDLGELGETDADVVDAAVCVDLSLGWD